MNFRYFSCNTNAPHVYSVGDFVLVEGERGEDLGMVVELLNMTGYVDKVRAGNHSLEEEEYKLRRIVRLATTMERAQLPQKYHDEQIAGKVCAFPVL